MAREPDGPKALQVRALREARVAANKRLIDDNVKTRARIIGKIGNVKVSDTKVGMKTAKRASRRAK